LLACDLTRTADSIMENTRMSAVKFGQKSSMIAVAQV